jgi:PRTRC genetic system ThiF family protein
MQGQAPRFERVATVVIVGCGGTGSHLAEAVCRLLIGLPAALFLVDMDRVEAHNVGRQAYDRADVGRFKAQALAERLARRFGREVGYAVAPYDAGLHTRVFETRSRLNLVIGCVDNAAARRAIAASIGRPRWRLVRAWWVDCGNGRNSGQVLLGNAVEPDELRGAFLPHLGVCRALPAPSLQRPDLLTVPPEPLPSRLKAQDCAEAVARGEQGPTVNQFVAALAASYVEKLLAGSCSWMSSYFDLDDGVLRCVAAEPKTVAALAGLHLNAVAPVPHRRLRASAPA